MANIHPMYPRYAGNVSNYGLFIVCACLRTFNYEFKSPHYSIRIAQMKFSWQQVPNIFFTIPTFIQQTINARTYYHPREGGPKNPTLLRIWHDSGTVVTSSWSMLYIGCALSVENITAKSMFQTEKNTRFWLFPGSALLSVEKIENSHISYKTVFWKSHLFHTHSRRHILRFRYERVEPNHLPSNCWDIFMSRLIVET